jgi:hypothetical protein
LQLRFLFAAETANPGHPARSTWGANPIPRVKEREGVAITVEFATSAFRPPSTPSLSKNDGNHVKLAQCPLIVTFLVDAFGVTTKSVARSHKRAVKHQRQAGSALRWTSKLKPERCVGVLGEMPLVMMQTRGLHKPMQRPLRPASAGRWQHSGGPRSAKEQVSA